MPKQKAHAVKRNLYAEIKLVTDDELPEENPYFERLREAYAIAKTAHAEIYQALRVVQQKQATLGISELVDCQFALREMAALLDDVRKEAQKTLEVQATITCAKWVLQANADGTNKDIIHGTHCSGSPDLKTVANFPTFDKDPVRYNEIMSWLGVPEDLRDHGTFLVADEADAVFETEIVKINWTGWQCYIAALVAKGFQLPACIAADVKDTWIKYTVRITKLQDLL